MMSSLSRTGWTKLYQIWRIHTAIICAFIAHFNLHTCCIVSERQRASKRLVENRDEILHLFHPCKKLGEGGQNVRVRVSSSAKDSTCDFWWGTAACAERLNTIYRPFFHRGTIPMMSSQSWGSDLSQIWCGNWAMIAAFNAGFGL